MSCSSIVGRYHLTILIGDERNRHRIIPNPNRQWFCGCSVQFWRSAGGGQSYFRLTNHLRFNIRNLQPTKVMQMLKTILASSSRKEMAFRLINHLRLISANPRTEVHLSEITIHFRLFVRVSSGELFPPLTTRTRTNRVTPPRGQSSIQAPLQHSIPNQSFPYSCCAGGVPKELPGRHHPGVSDPSSSPQPVAMNTEHIYLTDAENGRSAKHSLLQGSQMCPDKKHIEI